jgi:hypothetical protein
MEPKRLDKVTVKTLRDTVVIPWASRDELLARLRGRLDAVAVEVVHAFEDIGASSPVALGPEAEEVLTNEIDLWVLETSIVNLPAGIWDLRCALIDDEQQGAARLSAD